MKYANSSIVHCIAATLDCKQLKIETITKLLKKTSVAKKKTFSNC